MTKMRETVFLAAAFVAGIAGVASAGTATVDGKYNGVGDSYDHSWSVSPVGPASGSMANATLYMTQDASYNLYVALVLPRTYVDNTYGGSGYTSANWSGNHNFNDLKGSDEAEFYLSSNSTTFFHGKMDYMNTSGSGATTVVGSSGFTGGDGSISTGNSSMIAAAQSSMGYNWSQFGYNMIDTNHDGVAETDKGFNIDTHSPGINTSTYAVTDTDFSDWQFDVVYELEIAASALGNQSVLGAGNTVINGFGFQLYFVHASPNMTGSNSNGYSITLTPTAIPLHPAFWMGGAMMGLVLLHHVQRRRKATLPL